jgi:phenylacetate-coenzyme A ligase PaaK-like adenylate-forming protein
MHTAILKSLSLLLSIFSLRLVAAQCNCTLTSTTTDVSTSNNGTVIETTTQYVLVAQSGGTIGVPLFCGYDPTSLAGSGDVSVRCFYNNSVSLNINITAQAAASVTVTQFFL